MGATAASTPTWFRSSLGSRVAGPARTVRCGKADNLSRPSWAHAAGRRGGADNSRAGPGGARWGPACDPGPGPGTAWASSSAARSATSSAGRDWPSDPGPLDARAQRDEDRGRPRSAATDILAAAREGEENKNVRRARLQAGSLSYDLDGLRAVVERG